MGIESKMMEKRRNFNLKGCQFFQKNPKKTFALAWENNGITSHSSELFFSSKTATFPKGETGESGPREGEFFVLFFTKLNLQERNKAAL